MVQRVLNCRTAKLGAGWILSLVVLLMVLPAFAGKSKTAAAEETPPDLLLEGGRKLTFERALSSEREIHGKPRFWTKLIDVVIGAPDYKLMVRPYSVAVDSRGRIIVTDPGIGGVHVFDVAQHKYKLLERKEKNKDSMLMPQCVAVDAKDNVYVTDSKAGKIFVFDANGKFRTAFGSLKGGEGYYKRPTGISIDPETQKLYVTDTLRDRVFELDSNGQVVRSFGQHGSGNGEFNLPTEVLARNGMVAVVDAMNFRVQIFDRNGNFKSSIGTLGDSGGQFFRPKGIGLDSEGHVYIVEGVWGAVQVFNVEGQLLYTFGSRGTKLGQFQLPAGLFIDRGDHVYVVDSYNHRVQIFQYHGLKTRAEGALQ